MPAIRAKITGVAHYVPPRVLDNAALEKLVDTTESWIIERTGIRTRHVVDPGVASSDLATEAARRLLALKGLAPDDIDLLIVATVTPDTQFPATACLVQDNLGAKKCWGFDLSGACSGFVYALTVGAQFVGAGTHGRVMVIGVDVMSSIIDYTDRATCVLFGDGAGAVLLEPCAEGEDGILDFLHVIDGSGRKDLHMPAGGSRRPASHETVERREHYVHQDGKQVFKYAVRQMTQVPVQLLERNGYTGQDVALFIPHQANERIIRAAAERLGLGEERVIINIARYGNTTAATIPIAMVEALETGRLGRGDLVVLASVGAGYTTGGVLLRWAY